MEVIIENFRSAGKNTKKFQNIDLPWWTFFRISQKTFSYFLIFRVLLVISKYSKQSYKILKVILKIPRIPRYSSFLVKI